MLADQRQEPLPQKIAREPVSAFEGSSIQRSCAARAVASIWPARHLEHWPHNQPRPKGRNIGHADNPDTPAPRNNCSSSVST